MARAARPRQDLADAHVAALVGRRELFVGHEDRQGGAGDRRVIYEFSFELWPRPAPARSPNCSGAGDTSAPNTTC